MANNQNNMQGFSQFLRSEITWTVSIILTVMGFVRYVVLPIQALQLGQAQIQQQLASESKRYVDIETRQNESDKKMNTIEKRQAVIMSVLSIKDKE